MRRREERREERGEERRGERKRGFRATVGFPMCIQFPYVRGPWSYTYAYEYICVCARSRVSTCTLRIYARGEAHGRENRRRRNMRQCSEREGGAEYHQCYVQRGAWKGWTSGAGARRGTSVISEPQTVIDITYISADVYSTILHGFPKGAP